MAKKKTGRGAGARGRSIALLAPAAPLDPPAVEAPEPDLEPPTELEEGLEASIAEALGGSVPAEPIAAEPIAAEPAAVQAEVGELDPEEARQRRARKGGRRTRRQLELENKELRRQLKADGDGAGPKAPPRPIDYGEAGQLVRHLLEMLFDTMAASKGDHWKLPPEKLDKLELHGGRALGPMLPALGALLPWFFFLTILGKETVARARIDAELAAKRKREGTPADTPAPTPASGGVH